MNRLPYPINKLPRQVRPIGETLSAFTVIRDAAFAEREFARLAEAEKTGKLTPQYEVGKVELPDRMK